MTNIKLKLEGQIGILSIRRNEVEVIAYIQFEDGSDDKKTYPKDETDEYVVNDLVDYYGYSRIG